MHVWLQSPIYISTYLDKRTAKSPFVWKQESLQQNGRSSSTISYFDCSTLCCFRWRGLGTEGLQSQHPCQDLSMTNRPLSEANHWVVLGVASKNWNELLTITYGRGNLKCEVQIGFLTWSTETVFWGDGRPRAHTDVLFHQLFLRTWCLPSQVSEKKQQRG